MFINRSNRLQIPTHADAWWNGGGDPNRDLRLRKDAIKVCPKSSFPSLSVWKLTKLESVFRLIRFELLSIVRKHSDFLKQGMVDELDESDLEMDHKFWNEMLDLYFISTAINSKGNQEDDLVFFVKNTVQYIDLDCLSYTLIIYKIWKYSFLSNRFL